MKDQIFERINSYNSGRLAGVLPVKYAAMAQDPFRFFRGTSHLFYEDVARDKPFGAAPQGWLCGDLHIENFGSYRGADRLVYFDLNDFDEGVLAPVILDLARLTVSVALAADGIAYSKRQARELMQALIAGYRAFLCYNKAKVIQQETAEGLVSDMINKVAGRKTKQLVAARTRENAGSLRLRRTDKLLDIADTDPRKLMSAFEAWFRERHARRGSYKVIDAGYRIAGTGSIGLRRYCLLLENHDRPKKRLLIDMKEAAPSTIARYLKRSRRVDDNEAERVVRVQDMMQHVTPDLLSAYRYEDRDFVVREIQPTEDKVSFDSVTHYPQLLMPYISDLAKISAAAVLRSSGRLGAANADALLQWAEKDDWGDALVQWAAGYAEQVKADYKAFKKQYEKLKG